MPQYLVTADFGRLGLGYVSEPETTRRDVIVNIACGEWPKVVSVLEIFEDEGTARNVTEDIASEVAEYLAAEQERVTWPVADWLHKNHPAGALATRGLEAA